MVPYCRNRMKWYVAIDEKFVDVSESLCDQILSTLDVKPELDAVPDCTSHLWDVLEIPLARPVRAAFQTIMHLQMLPTVSIAIIQST